ncbi:hypothetical protein [Streptomyces yunnanensis]|uniref:Uncharacterized protein n=1 Tax=Streptomyces yunnanensis TaxID=156453 RepID=A0A9X8QVX7_9ACTN|nr:hypothetical protein [Streptomyces yunnanensis]SHM52173.1 hypothetical protein SAMN05216268_111291 [Streptomyces yunnanensis]
MTIRSTAEDPGQVVQELTEWLDRYRQVQVGDASWAYRSFAALVAEPGTFYRSAPWPMSDPQQLGRCFKTASQWAERPGWTYVEGFALVPSAAPFNAVEHAWCLTGEGQVADPSLPDGMAVGYVGIPLSDGFRHEQQLLRATDAVFTSDPSNLLAGVNEQILRTGLPRHALVPGRSAAFPKR